MKISRKVRRNWDFRPCSVKLLADAVICKVYFDLQKCVRHLHRYKENERRESFAVSPAPNL
jgi:hypothetical protein